MSNLYQHILSNKASNKKMLAVLLDPDKCHGELLSQVLNQLEQSQPDFIFIGGSSQYCSTDDLLAALDKVPAPKILFPGDKSQFSIKADALLLLSLISGRNPDYLIGQHVYSALKIKKSGVQVIPVGYILVDGGTESAVKRVSKTEPIAADDIEKCLSTAVAGQLLGMQMIYLEAGSGALSPVSSEIISAVKNELDIPLIVGGGIKNINQLKKALDAGADLVVVGNIFESEAEKMGEFVRFVKEYC